MARRWFSMSKLAIVEKKGRQQTYPAGGLPVPPFQGISQCSSKAVALLAAGVGGRGDEKGPE